MDLSKTSYAALFLMLVLFSATFYGFTEISGEMAVHFDSMGEPDAYISVVPGLYISPGLAVSIFLLFQYLPKIDPLGENYESFEDLFEFLKLYLLGVFTYIQVLTVAWNIGYQYNITLMIAPVISVTYFLTAKIIEKADRNWFIGVKTPWTLSSDKVWKKTHQKTSPLLKIAAIISLTSLILPEYSIYFYAAPALAVTFFSFIYSYLIYNK